MVGLIFGILFLVAGIVLTLVAKKSEWPQPTIFSVIGVVCAIVLIALGCFTNVDTGHTGVVTIFGRVEDYTLDAGFHAKAPWQNITEMDNRVQKATISLSCFSQDIQEVECKYTLNYQISKKDAQTIYKTIGNNYYDTVITPNVSESVKTVMAHYTAEELIGNRDTLAASIEELLSSQLENYHIEVVGTAIEDIDFQDGFTEAVEAKQIAQQNKLRATTEQEQKTMEATQAAERQKIEAEAAAEVAKIQAAADLEVQKINADAAEYTGRKEAAKNEAIAHSLTPELIKYLTITQWNGELPQYYMSDDANLLIPLN